MKKFILSNIALVLLIVVPFGGWLALLRQDAYPLPPHKNLLFVGDSHIKYTINDEIISRAANLSKSGDPLLCSYINLRAVFNAENNIDTVVLGLWQKTLRSKTDDILELSKAAFDGRMGFVTMEDIEEAQLSPFSLLRSTLLTLFYNGDGLPLGRFEKNKRDNFKKSIEHANLELEREGVNPRVYKEGLQYRSLLRIRDLCEENGVKLILLSAPTYRADKYYAQEEFKRNLQDSLDGFTYIDYSYFPIPDSCFVDIGHLRFEGAEIFSNYINKHGVLGEAGQLIEL